MFTAKAFRCAANTPRVTRSAAPPVSSLTCRIRHNSSLTGAAEEQSTKEEAVSTSSNSDGIQEQAGSAPRVRKFEKKFKTAILERLLGVENVELATNLSLETRQLNRELWHIYDSQRNLRATVKGPYKVRRQVAPANKRVQAIEVRDNKVAVAGTTIPNIWLRDNCQCASCMHDATKQRLLDTFSIPKDITIRSHTFEGPDNKTLKVEWSDGHTSQYSDYFLNGAAAGPAYKSIQRQGLTSLRLWDSSVASNPPRTAFHRVNQTIENLLRLLRTYGFCYVDEVPTKDTKATKDLLKRIAFIRETHYGGFYDFTADLASNDTAYTNIALEAHTDTTYFSDPAGLQAFHLLSHTEGEGGASLLVDGFKVAEELQETDAKAYEILSTVNVHAHSSGNDGISIQPYRGFPVLEHDMATGDLLRVRWNSSDRASIELPIQEVETWYDAARKFDALLKKKENEYWEQLTPGRVLIFDNWRVLHGRSAFTGKRRICGAYLNRDDWISKYKMLEYGQDEVLKGLAIN